MEHSGCRSCALMDPILVSPLVPLSQFLNAMVARGWCRRRTVHHNFPMIVYIHLYLQGKPVVYDTHDSPYLPLQKYVTQQANRQNTPLNSRIRSVVMSYWVSRSIRLRCSCSPIRRRLWLARRC